ncbi:MAG: SDR family NAD(P)-dependent oxidoreductase [Anaerolineae bacterium]
MEVLHGKVAFVTGGSSGIGRAAAERLAEAGATVIIMARRADKLSDAAESISRATGQFVLPVPGDVTRAEDVARSVAMAISECGQIDVLVNAAGVGVLKPALELSQCDFDRMVAVNLGGVFTVTQAVARHMAVHRNGRVINLPGSMGRAVMGNAAGYCASKWGVVGLTKAMAVDLKRSGISFTLLYLGGVDSPFWDDIDMRVQRDKMLTVDDAAQAIVYAASQPANAVLNELVLQPESHQL